MTNTYETIRVLFCEDLNNIDMIFKKDSANWGVESLKDWCESYETTRFTVIGEREVIITSEYNMIFVKEWLRRYISIERMEEIL